jgi:hypothetical protein
LTDNDETFLRRDCERDIIEDEFFSEAQTEALEFDDRCARLAFSFLFAAKTGLESEP